MGAKFAECMRPHSLAHFVSGAGLGLLAIALVPALGANALILGVVLLVAGFVFDFFVNPGGKSQSA